MAITVILLLLLLHSNLLGFLKHQCEFNLDWDSISQIKEVWVPFKVQVQVNSLTSFLR